MRSYAVSRMASPSDAASGRGMSAYLALRAKGCTCGDEEYTPCPVHTEPGDNRGIRAWFQTGLPGGFPSPATCMVCGADGLIYPNVEIDNPEGSGEYKPTLICPRCSTPAAEARLVAEAERYQLNDKRVFGLAAVASRPSDDARRST